MINNFLSNKINITFFWIPSHIDIRSNDMVDKAAKLGAKNLPPSIALDLPFAFHEYKCEIERLIRDTFRQHLSTQNNFYSSHCCNFSPHLNPRLIWESASTGRTRSISSITCKLRLNALVTKYSSNVTCCCKQTISVQHLVKNCQITKNNIEPKINTESSFDSLLNNLASLFIIANMILNSNNKYIV